MKNPWKWAAIVLAVLLVLVIALPFLSGVYGGGYNWISPMHNWRSGETPYSRMPMMRGYWPFMGHMPVPFFGGFFMLLFALFPLGLLALAVWAVVALVRRNSKPSASGTAPSQPPPGPLSGSDMGGGSVAG